MDNNNHESFVQTDNKNKGDDKKTLILTCIIVCVIVVSLFVRCSKNCAENNNGEYNFIEDTDSYENGKRLDVTFSKFINCYNEYMNEEYGNNGYRYHLSREDFKVSADSGTSELILYNKADFYSCTAINIVVEESTDKIMSFQYIFTQDAGMDDSSIRISKGIMACATNNALSIEDISDTFEKFNNEDIDSCQFYGDVLYQRGLMFYEKIEQNEDGYVRMKFGFQPCTKEYYDDVLNN